MGTLTLSELQNVEKIVKEIQYEAYGKEMSALTTKQTIPSKHPLASLHPFADKKTTDQGRWKIKKCQNFIRCETPVDSSRKSQSRRITLAIDASDQRQLWTRTSVK